MSGSPEASWLSGTAGVWSFVLSVSHGLVVDPSHLRCFSGFIWDGRGIAHARAQFPQVQMGALVLRPVLLRALFAGSAHDSIQSAGLALGSGQEQRALSRNLAWEGWAPHRLGMSRAAGVQDSGQVTGFQRSVGGLPRETCSS
jgi:hypothetical protein